MTKRFLLLTAIALSLPSVGHAQIQTDARLKEAFRKTLDTASECVVRVQCDGKDIALGTIVTADGWILTKASDLKAGEIVCKLTNGKSLAAVRKGTDEKYDLTLLKVEADDLRPVEWIDSAKAPPGYWAISPGVGKEPVGLGVVSAPSRAVKSSGITFTPNPKSGMLGIGLDFDFDGVKFTKPGEGTPAEKAGIKEGDQALALNGQAVKASDEFLALMQKHKPGETITLNLLRDGKEFEVKATLAKRPPGSANGDAMGSQLSARRSGFPTILQHDAVLKPADCGGPVCDTKGRAFGVNISRVGRTETHAIPSEVVRTLLPQLKEDRQ